ncbi:hypothetical protein GQ43DRAFT_441502 [Delitschia confertaspora ATCC 74209]|uniref:Rhodopsin domain-containing protein n=1 Tax=Delitschia confertaspora ATCC 74209 TaxID=1513339 RepID=A0A9P4MS10_9PLEO|nr:hypothetical protein GQ43DRAFT_441502 [Delitschia confertaspora ATCC 74209]
MVDQQQTGALVITCLFPILSGIFVALRCLSRYMGRNFGWDDGLICVSLLFLLAETICGYQFIILSHTGYHVQDRPVLSIDEQVTVMKWSFAYQVVYHPMMGLIRASIIMFLFRIEDARPFIRAALDIVFWINMGYIISTTFGTIFQCSPINYVYMRPAIDRPVNGEITAHGKCINSLSFTLSSCALGIFMDLIIIPIPTAMVWNLEMRKKIKIAVVIIMSMGWIATAASVVRFIVYWYRFGPSQKDRTYNIGLVMSIVEPATAIITACAPALKSLMSRVLPRLLSTGNSTRYYTRSARSRSGPRPSHSKSLSLSHAASKAVGNGDSRVNGLGMEEDGYGLSRLSSTDSREDYIGVEITEPVRTRSKGTATTMYSDPEDSVSRFPKQFLNHDH